MNLEALEQRCLGYLKQVSHPIVPLDRLGEYVRRQTEFGAITDDELEDFLREHELFEVFDPIRLAAEEESAQVLAAEGIPVSPLVVLCTRVPTRRDLSAHVETVLKAMNESLTQACHDAQQAGDAERARQIVALMNRAESIRERLRAYD